MTAIERATIELRQDLRKRGRPRSPAELRATSTSIWLSPARIAKLRTLGGSRWIAAMIDGAKLG